MEKKNDNLEELFRGFNGQWETEEPFLGHQQRFLKKLKNKKKKKPKSLLIRLVVPVAAAILALLGTILMFEHVSANPQAATISPKVKETEMYFSSIIERELIKVQKEHSPETKVLIEDALTHLSDLEKDYTKLTQELLTKGENKQIMHAMIINLQTRISFLDEVLERIDNIKKLKANYNESKIL